MDLKDFIDDSSPAKDDEHWPLDILSNDSKEKEDSNSVNEEEYWTIWLHLICGW